MLSASLPATCRNRLSKMLCGKIPYTRYSGNLQENSYYPLYSPNGIMPNFISTHNRTFSQQLPWLPLQDRNQGPPLQILLVEPGSWCHWLIMTYMLLLPKTMTFLAPFTPGLADLHPWPSTVHLKCVMNLDTTTTHFPVSYLDIPQYFLCWINRTERLEWELEPIHLKPDLWLIWDGNEGTQQLLRLLSLKQKI